MVHGDIARNQHLFENAAAGRRASIWPRVRRIMAVNSPGRRRSYWMRLVDVGAMPRLGVERRLDGQHLARREIHQLRRQRGGAQVDYGAEARARFERRRLLVGEHRQRPLVHFHHDAVARLGAAGQTPAVGQLRLGQGLPHGRRNGNVAGKDADLAPATGGLAAARELDAQFE